MSITTNNIRPHVINIIHRSTGEILVETHDSVEAAAYIIEHQGIRTKVTGPDATNPDEDWICSFDQDVDTLPKHYLYLEEDEDEKHIEPSAAAEAKRMFFNGAVQDTLTRLREDVKGDNIYNAAKALTLWLAALRYEHGATMAAAKWVGNYGLGHVVLNEMFGQQVGNYGLGQVSLTRSAKDLQRHNLDIRAIIQLAVELGMLRLMESSETPADDYVTVDEKWLMTNTMLATEARRRHRGHDPKPVSRMAPWKHSTDNQAYTYSK